MGNKQAMIDFVVDWCNDDSHGYDQSDRWGPNCDCSSLMYMAAYHAGYDVPFGSGYTGTMLNDFTNAGFEAVPFDGNLYDCESGCIALNVQNHTEMFVDWGVLGGARIDENGNIAGGQSGDQTGNEVSICSAYNYPWDYILIPPEDSGDTPQPSPEPSGNTPAQPRYRVRTLEDGWLDTMEGLHDTGGSGDDFAGIEGHLIHEIEVENLGAGGWYEIFRADGSSSRNEQGNIESPVTGVTFYYDTNIEETGGVYYKAVYQAHWQGSEPDWGKEEYDDEDGGAGKDESSPLDMIRLRIERA